MAFDSCWHCAILCQTCWINLTKLLGTSSPWLDIIGRQPLLLNGRDRLTQPFVQHYKARVDCHDYRLKECETCHHRVMVAKLQHVKIHKTSWGHNVGLRLGCNSCCAASICACQLDRNYRPNWIAIFKYSKFDSHWLNEQVEFCLSNHRCKNLIVNSHSAARAH